MSKFYDIEKKLKELEIVPDVSDYFNQYFSWNVDENRHILLELSSIPRLTLAYPLERIGKQILTIDIKDDFCWSKVRFLINFLTNKSSAWVNNL